MDIPAEPSVEAVAGVNIPAEPFVEAVAGVDIPVHLLRLLLGWISLCIC